MATDIAALEAKLAENGLLEGDDATAYAARNVSKPWGKPQNKAENRLTETVMEAPGLTCPTCKRKPVDMVVGTHCEQCAKGTEYEMFFSGPVLKERQCGWCGNGTEYYDEEGRRYLENGKLWHDSVETTKARPHR